MSKSPRHRPLRALGSRAKAKQAEPAPAHSIGTPRHDLSFSEVAKSAGVVPLARTPGRVTKGGPKHAVTATAPAPFTVEQDDGWVTGYRSELGPSLLRRLRGTPSATLDLHGASVTSARRELAVFLTAERAKGRSLVRVIVGKGHHSPGGHAVLRSELADWLTSAPARAEVLAFQTAPPKLGGSGSVLVLLAPPG